MEKTIHLATNFVTKKLHQKRVLTWRNIGGEEGAIVMEKGNKAIGETVHKLEEEKAPEPIKEKTDEEILMDFFDSVTSCAWGKPMFGHNNDRTLCIRSTGEIVSLEDAVTYMKMFVCTMLGFIEQP